MIYKLQNEYLIVKAESTGAELKSIKKISDDDNIEYLWQLNPDIWERQAPLLFPVIGRLKDEEYTYKGKIYKIDIHGFARFMEFEVIQISNSEISFILEDNEETITEYPFKFRLTVKYALSGNSIIKSHKIENMGKDSMPYEIGGHEGYNLSLFNGERMEDYYIEFPGMETVLTYTADENVMMNKEKREVGLDDGKIYLSPEVFKNDALIMEDFKIRKVILKNIRNNRGIIVEFSDFKYLGLWTKYMRTDYVCIEPWSSLPDCNYLGKELVDKQDVRLLKVGESEQMSYSITVL